MTLDLREDFRRAVVEPFVRGYERGETPNPCIRCNGGFRFGELLASRAAPGPRGSRPATTRASSSTAAGSCSRARADPAKDQSYMLATLDPAELERLWFPLGEQTKAETRAEAARAGLAAARRPRARRRASSQATTTASSSAAAA